MHSAYKFHNPGKVRILAARTHEQETIIDTSGSKWRWVDGGKIFRVDWDALDFKIDLTNIFKGFIFHRLEVNSPHTVGVDVQLIKLISNSHLKIGFPWSETDVLSFLTENEFKKKVRENYSFRALYVWALDRGIKGFDRQIALHIKESKPNESGQYDKIFLRQNVITPSDEILLLKYLNKHANSNEWSTIRNIVVLQLGFELAPRPIQIHSIDETDFHRYGLDNQKYYSIDLPMAKKIRSGSTEKRPRSISDGLGKKIEILIKRNNEEFKASLVKALFKRKDGVRLSSPEITKIVSIQMRMFRFKKGDGLNLLRHHLGQSLADQGASAEVIAETLGHNSTVASRAYVGATPEIATIKTRALGKNGTYLDIMKMLLTGEIIEKDKSPKDRRIKGMIGSQYIGGIGSCGLPTNTSCPLNPVYSCYTCKKFHPFIDGSHNHVKEALQKQSQYFVDIAEKSQQIESNRALTQLESTIEAVDSVIIQCNNKPQNNEA